MHRRRCQHAVLPVLLHRDSAADEDRGLEPRAGADSVALESPADDAFEVLVGRHHRHEASARHVDACVERDRERCRDLQIFGDADAEHRPQHLVVVLLTSSDAAHPRLIELPAALAECRRRAAEHRPVSGGHRRLWCGEEHAGQEKSRVQHMGRIFQSSVGSLQSAVGSRQSPVAVASRSRRRGQSRVRPRGLHGEPSGCDDCRPPP